MKAWEVAEIIAILARAYPNSNVSEGTSAVYEATLADLEFELTKRAVLRLITLNKWFPTVAEIREAVTDLHHGPKRLGAEAWCDVGLEIRRTGYIGEPAFADPLVAECVAAIGWRSLCLGTNEAADRARFIELYDGLHARARADQVSGIALPARPAQAALPRRTAPMLSDCVPELPAARVVTRSLSSRESWGDQNESVDERHARLKQQARELLEQEKNG